jgi:hypothetical protein
MHSIGLWDTRHPVGINHCFTPSNAVIQARRQRLARLRSAALGLRPGQEASRQTQELLFYLSPRATEAAHQIGAILELLDSLGPEQTG